MARDGLQHERSDNAATLYYEAFLAVRRNQISDATGDELRQLAKGKTEPTEQLKDCVRGFANVTELVLAAAEIDNCDWGLDYSRGMSVEIPWLLDCRLAGLIVLADAQIHLSNGKYKEALHRCLAAAQMAEQVSKGPLICCLSGLSILHTTNQCVQNILARLHHKGEILQWFSRGLSEIGSSAAPFAQCVEQELQLAAKYMRKETVESVLPCRFEEWANARLPKQAAEFAVFAPEQFLPRNQKYWEQYAERVRAALTLPYAEAYSALKELDERATDDAESIDGAMTGLFAGNLHPAYNVHTRTHTFSNAVVAATRVYLACTETGKMPDALPEDLPKDLFSGKNFEYTKNGQAFALRCPGKDLLENRHWQYRFSAAK